jgi:hypothetical protein
MTIGRPSMLGALLSTILACAACGGGGAATVPGGPATSSSSAQSAASYTCPAALTSSGALDCTKLPLGDLKVSAVPKAGYIVDCQTPSGSPVVTSAPWLDAATNTWNAVAKTVVSGTVSWPGTFTAALANGGTSLDLAGNGLPPATIPTGTFPIGASDPAYRYDRNPNRIASQNVNFVLPADPVPAATPSCLSGGTIGVTVTGVSIYDAFDAAGYDAVAREIQDGCHGHPDQSDTYHYHGWLQACVPDAGSASLNSSLLGYARDGFGIYGPWYDGKILTTADLDACHGTTSAVMWNGVLTTIYHYVSTYDFPYTLGCYKGTPV